MFFSQKLCAAESEASYLSSVGPHVLRNLIFHSGIFYVHKFLATAINLSLFSATRSNTIAYCMPKHLPGSGIDRLYTFALSSSLLFFSSIWRPNYNPPASFRPIPLTFYDLKPCESIMLSCLLFVMEPNSIVSLRHAGLRSGRSTFNQIIFLSPTIWYGSHKLKPDTSI